MNNADIKAYIQRYFSDELQYDETPVGAMERNQLKKWMLEWAKDYTVPQTTEAYMREWAKNQPLNWPSDFDHKHQRPEAVQTGGGWAPKE